MDKKEVQKIIGEYKPHKGFFDLSNKPKDLSSEEYAKILNAQNLLVSQNVKDHIQYLRKYNPSQLQFLQKLSGDLQGIIFRYWGNSVFN